MTNEPFNSEQQQAEQLDQWITAIQSGQTPKNDAMAELAQLVEIGRVIQAEDEFTRDLEQRLATLHSRRARKSWPRQVSWLSAIAAIALVSLLMLLTVNALIANRQHGAPDHEILGTATPVALAATEHVQVPLPTVMPVSTNEAMVDFPTSTPSTTLAVTLPGTATGAPTLTPTTTMTPRPTLTAFPTMTAFPSPTGLAGPSIGPIATSVLDSTMVVLPPSSPTLDPFFTTAIPFSLPTITVTPEPTEEPMIVIGATSIAFTPSFTATPMPLSTPVFDPQYQSMTEAGEIDDNAEFETYLTYRESFLRQMPGPVHDVDVSERHTIQVQTRNGFPALGAEVLIYDQFENLLVTLQTTATGHTYFFPRAYPATQNVTDFLVVVRRDLLTSTFTLTREQPDEQWAVVLDAPPALSPVQLDILFLLDSTGSMSDEINELKNNILSMSQQIAMLPGEPDTRFSLVTYRDRGDLYVTQTYEFTSDVNTFQATLLAVQSGGGGDGPESLNQALHEAINAVSWRENDTVKLIILIADAPPHLDYPDDYDYAVAMQQAAARGIKIHAVASSGLPLDGEYIFRQIAQYTGGHFVFLLYDSSPQTPPADAPPDAPLEPGTPHEVDDTRYSVEFLDELVVRLIAEELASLRGK